MPDRSSELEELGARQAFGLWLAGRDAVRTVEEAKRFLSAVGFALRYNATEGLPLASMFEAAAGTKIALSNCERDRADKEEDSHRRAVELANALIADREAIEVSVIAGRLVLVHRSLMPAIYALRRRGRKPDDLAGLSVTAQQAYEFISQHKRVSVGRVCAHFGLKSTQYPSEAYDAIACLQRELLIDRGPADIPRGGIPYLSKEGIPYRVFDQTHEQLVAEAKRLRVEEAARAVLLRYLEAAVFVTTRKLGSMFKLCLSPEELRSALVRLQKQEKIRLVKLGRTEIVSIT